MNEDSKVKVLMEQHNKELKALNEGVAIILGKMPKLDKIEERLDRIEDNVEVIKTSLRRKVDIEDFQILEKRVIFLEKKLRA